MSEAAPRGIPKRRPESGLTLAILKDAAAEALLRDGTFHKRWKALYDECPWATVFQSEAFVRTWYGVYGSRFRPVVVLGTDSRGQLAGLLLLACLRESHELIAAGANQAEYQAWLAQPQAGNVFIEQALSELSRQFPRRVLRLVYLPPGAPIDWTAAGRPWASRCRLLALSRPLMALGDGGQARASLAKKRYKARFARLEKMGALSFRQIVDPPEFAQALDQIIPLCNFRQGAVHGILPFRKNPLMRSLYLALIEVPDLLHVTVLKLGEQILSAQINVRNKDQVLLQIITHTPFLAEYSPGTLHILLLAAELARQGIHSLDLTPEGSYKDRFATNNDQVHILTVFFSRRQSLQARARDFYRNAVRRLAALCHVEPSRVRAVVADCRRRVLEVRSRQDLELRIYACTSAGAPAGSSLAPANRNLVKDLLAYQPEPRGEPIAPFLNRALKRLEKGVHVYTCVEGGRLACHGWLLEPGERAFPPELPPLPLDAQSAVVFDCASWPPDATHHFYPSLLRQMLGDAFASPGVSRAYVVVPASDAPLRRAVEESGVCEYEFSLVRVKRFGRPVEWSKVPAS